MESESFRTSLRGLLRRHLAVEPLSDRRGEAETLTLREGDCETCSGLLRGLQVYLVGIYGRASCPTLSSAASTFEE